jgi:hypothetical protein
MASEPYDQSRLKLLKSALFNLALQQDLCFQCGALEAS